MKQDKVNVTSEELYVLGKVLNGKYIDYAYIATMKEIGNNRKLYEKEVMGQLVAKGLLEEDFDGNINPTEVTINMCTPIFFGIVETTMEICTINQPIEIETYKFHFFDNQITKIQGVEGNLEAEIIENSDIDELVREVTNNCNISNISSDVEFKTQNIDKVIAVKSKYISQDTTIRVYFEAKGQLYRENECGEMIQISKNEMSEEMITILKGVK